MARVSDDDRAEANRCVLAALARGDDLDSIVDAVADRHVRHNTFPGEEHVRLAAAALRHAEVTRDGTVDYESLLPNHLPEVDLRGKRRSRFQYAALTAFAVHGGLEPDLLDEVTYLIEPYWQSMSRNVCRSSSRLPSAPRHRADRSGRRRRPAASTTRTAGTPSRPITTHRRRAGTDMSLIGGARPDPIGTARGRDVPLGITHSMSFGERVGV